MVCCLIWYSKKAVYISSTRAQLRELWKKHSCTKHKTELLVLFPTMLKFNIYVFFWFYLFLQHPIISEILINCHTPRPLLWPIPTIEHERPLLQMLVQQWSRRDFSGMLWMLCFLCVLVKDVYGKKKK